MTNLTQKDLEDYKSHEAASWHDADWHAYEKSDACEAFHYADSTKEPDDTDSDIIARAQAYLSSKQENLI